MMIEFRGVSKIYGNGVQALRGVDLKIEKGELVVIAGPSGAGKSTLLKLVLGEEKPSRGQVMVEGNDVNDLDKKEMCELRKRIGSVFQDYKLLASQTVEENVSFVLRAIEASDEEVQKYVPQVLEIVRLGNRGGSFPGELSSGEAQRASIARAIIHKPEIFLADEPTGNLDPSNTSEIVKLLKRIHELGATVVLATHNRDVIKSLDARTVLIKDGVVIKDSPDGRVLL